MEWFTELGIIGKIFWLIAIPFSVIFLIQMIMTFIGIGGDDVDIDTDVDVDADIDADIDTDADIEGSVEDSDINDADRAGKTKRRRFKLFTVRSIIAFFMVFSWVGLICVYSKLNTPITFTIAFISGFAMMFVVALIMHLLFSMEESGNIVLNNAVNSEGKVYLPIPAEYSGVGKVQVKVQSSLQEMDAITVGEKLPTGTKIKVIGIVKGKLLVERIQEDSVQ